jgi:predicted nucleic acid-binding protein
LSGFLDTSVIVRYLTGDTPDLSERAARIIEEVSDLQVSEGVLAEAAHVLSSVYRMPRQAIVDLLMALVQRQNISTYALNKGLVLQALLMCRPSGRISFADAMTWAVARSAGSEVVYSFDERFPEDGLEVRRGV